MTTSSFLVSPLNYWSNKTIVRDSQSYKGFKRVSVGWMRRTRIWGRNYLRLRSRYSRRRLKCRRWRRRSRSWSRNCSRRPSRSTQASSRQLPLNRNCADKPQPDWLSNAGHKYCSCNCYPTRKSVTSTRNKQPQSQKSTNSSKPNTKPLPNT